MKGKNRCAAFGIALALACAGNAPTRLPDSLLADLQGDAEQARGLRFPRPVEAWLLPPERVRAVLAAELDVALPDALARRRARMQEALGLLPAGTDLRRTLLDFQSAAVVGFYTPLRDRLYLVGDAAPDRPLAAPARALAIHELVHALQAAHTRLLDVLLGLEDHDDLAFALSALLEGDATWAAFRHEWQTEGTAPPPPEAVASDYSPDWAEQEFPQIPRLVRESFVLLYPTGYALVDRLVAAEGIGALAGALLDPPLSSEELLHPERYLDPRERRSLPVFRFEGVELAPQCTELGSNSFGEIGLRIWARERGAVPEQAADLASAWDGDRAVAFDCPHGTAFAWLVQFDSAAAAARFAAAAGPLAAGIEPAGLAAPVRVDTRAMRVLLSAGLGDAALALLDEEPERFADLDAYLAARPEIEERADSLRQRAAQLR